MRAIASRLTDLEDRVHAIPVPRGALPMTLAEFVGLYPGLGDLVEFLAIRAAGGKGAIHPWARDSITPEACQRLIHAVAEQDEKARGTGRPIPSSGLMGGAAREAKKYLREHAALAVTAGGSA